MDEQNKQQGGSAFNAVVVVAIILLLLGMGALAFKVFRSGDTTSDGGSNGGLVDADLQPLRDAQSGLETRVSNVESDTKKVLDDVAKLQKATGTTSSTSGSTTTTGGSTTTTNADGTVVNNYYAVPGNNTVYSSTIVDMQVLNPDLGANIINGANVVDGSLTVFDINTQYLSADYLDNMDSTDFVAVAGDTMTGDLTIDADLIVNGDTYLTDVYADYVGADYVFTPHIDATNAHFWYLEVWEEISNSFGNVYVNDALDVEYLLTADGGLMVNNGATIDDLTVTGDIDAQGNIENTMGDVTVNDDFVVVGNSDLRGEVFNSTGNVFINDDVDVAGDVLPTADMTYDLGSNTLRWNQVYAGTADVATLTDSGDGIVNVVSALNVAGDVLPMTNGVYELGASGYRWDTIWANYLDFVNAQVDYLIVDVQLDSRGQIVNTTGTVYVNDTMNVTGAVDFDSTLDVQGNIMNTSGNVTVGDNLVVTGTSDLQGSVYDSTGNLTVNDNLDVTQDLDVDADTTLGTTSGDTLQVNATSTFAAAVIAQGTIDAQGAISNTTGYNAGYVHVADSLDVDGSLSVGNDSEFGGDVSIAPTKTLRVDFINSYSLGGIDILDDMRVDGDILPTGSYNIGASANRWTNVYATNLYGTLSGAVNATNLVVTGTSDLQGSVSNSTGTLTFGDDVAVTGTSDLQGSVSDSTGTLTFGDDVAVTGTSDLQGSVSNSTGTLTFGDDVAVTGTSDLQGSVSSSTGNVTVNDSLDVTQALDVNGNVDLTNGLIVTDDTLDTVNMGGGLLVVDDPNNAVTVNGQLTTEALDVNVSATFAGATIQSDLIPNMAGRSLGANAVANRWILWASDIDATGTLSIPGFADVASTLTGLNTSITNINTSITNINTSISGINTSITALDGRVTTLEAAAVITGCSTSTGIVDVSVDTGLPVTVVYAVSATGAGNTAVITTSGTDTVTVSAGGYCFVGK